MWQLPPSPTQIPALQLYPSAEHWTKTRENLWPCSLNQRYTLTHGIRENQVFTASLACIYHVKWIQGSVRRCSKCRSKKWATCWWASESSSVFHLENKHNFKLGMTNTKFSPEEATVEYQTYKTSCDCRLKESVCVNWVIYLSSINYVCT